MTRRPAPIQSGDILAFGVMMVTPVLVVFPIFQEAFVASVARRLR